MVLGLLGNPHKEKIVKILPTYIEWLEQEGIDHVVADDFRRIEGIEDRAFVSAEKVVDSSDILLSFGGDGTLLNTIRLLSGREIPVCGVNLGGLGYLTEVRSGELTARTRELLAGNWTLDARMILETWVEGGGCEGPWYALNDVVVDKAGYSRMIRLRTHVDGRYLNTYRADGLITATPTGSTAYSLSAGGPILEPNMDALLVMPISPHSLTNRPLVIQYDKKVSVEPESLQGVVVLSVDGEVACEVPNEAIIHVQRAPFTAHLVKFEGRMFYEILRQKLGWGDINS
ncbi:NAD(+) kinase [bacterium]|nr:NAD(+) kinase [bacterium]